MSISSRRASTIDSTGAPRLLRSTDVHPIVVKRPAERSAFLLWRGDDRGAIAARSSEKRFAERDFGFYQRGLRSCWQCGLMTSEAVAISRAFWPQPRWTLAKSPRGLGRAGSFWR